ncbi:MAG: LytTR family transcriptional regulator, partial [Bacteroidales bacterium]|nr:LytTR family transcriptional regulator [Bacteroidales bacterium]
IVLKTQESIHIVKLSDIIRCEADHNYCTFYFVNGKKIVVSRKLGEFEEMLNGLFFFRTHQSHLININHILSFEKNEGGYLKMADNSSVPVSKRKKEELLELFGKL